MIDDYDRGIRDGVKIGGGGALPPWALAVYGFVMYFLGFLAGVPL